MGVSGDFNIDELPRKEFRMIEIEQLQRWLERYTDHQRACSLEGVPRHPLCFIGYRIWGKCLSLGPMAYYKKKHEDTCDDGCRHSLPCADGRQLWDETVGRFRYGAEWIRVNRGTDGTFPNLQTTVALKNWRREWDSNPR
jgi:hypothetical protein